MVIGVAVGNVGRHVDGRQPAIRRREVEAGNRATVVRRAHASIGTGVWNVDRNRERGVRQRDVVALVLIAEAAPHIAGPDPEAGHQFTLEERGDFVGARVLERGIQRLGRDAAAARDERRGLLARIPAAVGVEVGPFIPSPPRRGVLAGVEDEIGAGIPPVLAVVELEHALAVATEIVGDAKARRHQVESDHVVVGRERDGRRIEPARCVRLLGREGAVPVEAQPDVQRQPAGRSPRIVGVGTVSPQAADRLVRCLEEDDVERRAVLHDVQDVLFIAVLVDVDHRFVEDLAAEFEIVLADPVVLEEAQRAERLIAPALARPVAVAAVDEIVADVLVAQPGAIHAVVPVVSVLTAANLGKRAVAQDAIPLGLVYPCPEILIPCRRFRRVDAGVDAEEERVEALRLFFLRGLGVADDFVVLRQVEGDLGAVVVQDRRLRLHREVDEPRFDVLVPVRSVPP